MRARGSGQGPGLEPRVPGNHRGPQSESRGPLSWRAEPAWPQSVIGQRSLWSHPRVRRGTSS